MEAPENLPTTMSVLDGMSLRICTTERWITGRHRSAAVSQSLNLIIFTEMHGLGSMLYPKNYAGM